MFTIKSGKDHHTIISNDESEMVLIMYHLPAHVAFSFGEKMPGHYLTTCRGRLQRDPLIKNKEFIPVYCDGDLKKLDKYKDTICRLARLQYGSFG